MSATTSGDTRTGVKRRWGLAFAVAASAVTLLAGGQPASAYTQTQSGYVGSLTTPSKDTGAWISFGSGRSAGHDATAGKAPAYSSSNQYICSTTRLYQLSSVNGRQKWTLDGTFAPYKQCAWAGAGGVNFSGVSYDGLIPLTGYSTDTTYTWQLANGTTIGSRYIDMSQRADYQCLTTGCLTGTSTVGGYIQFDFTL